MHNNYNANRTNRGFTLAELLIVVAIIAVLVAIAIPVFSRQLEKSREATDAANIRSQYAVILTASIEIGGDVNVDGDLGTIALKQKLDGWQDEALEKNLGSIVDAVDGSPTEGGHAWISIEQGDEATVTLHFDGVGSGGGGGGGGEGGEGGGEGGEGTDGRAQNESTAHEIAEALIDIMTEYGSGNSTKVTITVNPDGTFGISIEGKKSNLDNDTVISGLQSAGLLSSGGTIAFDQSDDYYVNGYSVRVNKNNGNGGNITITKL